MEEAVVEETSYLTTTLFAGTLLYLLFYVFKVVHRPMLIGCEGKFKSRLNKLDILNEYYVLGNLDTFSNYISGSTQTKTACAI